MNKMFTWLQISDLHFKVGDSYDRNIVLDGLIEDIKVLRGEHKVSPDFLKRLFTGSTLLFYGYSFSDPNIDFALQELMELYEGMTKPHYAVLPDPGKIKKRFLSQNYNIRVIPYKLWNNSHDAAFRFLEKLASSC